MSRNYNYNNHPYGGDDSQSYIDEYLEHVTMLQRMPSVATDIPPEVRISPQDNDHHKRTTPHRVKHDQNRAPEKHKKVHIAEHEEVIKIDRDGKRQVHEDDKTIDVEADGFIQQKHKKFDLSKWDTLKAY